MSVYDRDFTKINPKTIATECSPVHIENVLKAMQDEIALLKREKTTANAVAITMMHGLKNSSADASWNGAIDECIEVLS